MKIKIDNSSSYSFNKKNKILEIYLYDRYFSLFRVIDDSFVNFSQVPEIPVQKIYAFKKSLYPFLTDIKNNFKNYPVHFQITIDDISRGEIIK